MSDSLTVGVNNSHKKRTTLLWLLGASFIAGLVIGPLEEGTDLYRIVRIATSLLSVIILMRWFVLDAQEHEYKIPKPLFFSLIAVTALAAPVYFILTRGSKALIPIIKALLFFLLLLGIASLGAVISALLFSFLFSPISAI